MKLSRQSGRAVLTLATFAVVAVGGAANAKDRAYRVIHDFQGSSDGWGPFGVAAAAENGNLYGVTIGGGTSDLGTVFKLAAPRTRSGAWKKTVLYNFTNGDPGYATALVIGKDGVLYGAGNGPNTRGFIFQLTPPVGGGSWRYELLDTFTSSSDGSAIQGIALDAKGNVYGATELGGDLSCGNGSGCGTVFELKRPTKDGGRWVLSVLHTFTGQPDGEQPFAGVTLDQEGNVYGTASGGAFGYGAVYSVSPPAKKGGAWTETVVYSFDAGTNIGIGPSGPVTFDESGNMYGTTVYGGDLNCSGGAGCGVVFELSPQQGGTWTYTNLYSFHDGNDGAVPRGYIVIDSKGDVYSTTTAGGKGSDAGTAFKLSPPSQKGETWTEVTLHSFNAPENAGDAGGLIRGQWGDLYGVTYLGGKYNGGVVFELHP